MQVIQRLEKGVLGANLRPLWELGITTAHDLIAFSLGTEGWSFCKQSHLLPSNVRRRKGHFAWIVSSICRIFFSVVQLVFPSAGNCLLINRSDYVQSLFLQGESESTLARASSSEAARREKLSRHAPSVTCVSRAFCSTDEEKRDCS